MSVFNIAQSDLTPSPLSASDYAVLAAGVSSLADEVVAPCEDLFVSWLGGTPTTAANIALCKPQLVYVVVWYLHYKLAQSADYEIPKGVQASYDAARAWALHTGQALLAAEGTAQLPGQPALQASYETARFKRAQMDLL